jgi:hypothetical protein
LLNKRFVFYFIKHQLHLWKWLHKIHNILNKALSSEIKRIVNGHSKQTTNILKDSIIIMRPTKKYCVFRATRPYLAKTPRP